MVVLSSETGVLPVKPEDVTMKGRLQPGKMFLVDLEQGRIVSDREIKEQLATRQPYAEWLASNQITLESLSEPARVHGSDHATIMVRQRAFGYTDEDVRFLMTPMAVNGEEPIGSMGTDIAARLPVGQAAAAVQLLQTALRAGDQPADRSHSRRDGDVARQLHRQGAEHPGGDAAALPYAQTAASDHSRTGIWKSCAAFPRAISSRPRCRLSFPWPMERKGSSASLDGLCRRASLAIQNGYTILILSDRGIDPDYAPIPSLLAMTAVHNHLVREGSRTQVALIIESGEPREVMHYALLIGYGASAINPYLAIETLEDLAMRGLSAGRRRLRKSALSIPQVHQ